MNAYELQIQAEYYSNIPILDRSFRSTVHLEDKQDEYFWDILLQKYRPGKYYYVYHSKRSNIPGGCKNAKNFILQTYTYSWENHFCLAYKLQQTLQLKLPFTAQRFNFESFLSKYLCRKEDCNFEKDILLADLQTSGYWQMDKIKEDIKQLQ